MAEDRQPSGEAESGSGDVLGERRAKLERLREAGVEPFPHSFADRTGISEVRAAHEGLGAGDETQDRYRVAGRISARRDMGRAAFIDLRDGGGKLQLQAKADVLGDEDFERLVGLDLGDILGAEGTVFATKRGELTLKVESWVLLAKSLRPPPRSTTASRTRRPAFATASST